MNKIIIELDNYGLLRTITCNGHSADLSNCTIDEQKQLLYMSAKDLLDLIVKEGKAA